MHSKVKNFFGFIADNYESWFVESPPPKEDGEEPDVVALSDPVSIYIRNIASDKAEFKQFQFGYLAVACNNERLRPRISVLRELFKNEENMKMVVCNIRKTCKRVRTFIDKIDAVPDTKIEEFIVKFSRYINLFTLMYFK